MFGARRDQESGGTAGCSPHCRRRTARSGLAVVAHCWKRGRRNATRQFSADSPSAHSADCDQASAFQYFNPDRFLSCPASRHARAGGSRTSADTREAFRTGVYLITGDESNGEETLQSLVCWLGNAELGGS